jgi:penicillin G amidase
LMIPGVPVFGIGRTPHLAWGGTNMRAASSDIVKIEKDDVISSRDIEIRRRLWRTSRRSVRISKFGPVISDSKLMRGRKSEMLALKWVGHSPTDEISALYRAIRARDKDEFRDAFESFGVSSQNFLFADSEQNVGQLMAAWLPKREAFQSDDFVLNSNSMPRDWAEFKKCNSLPAVYKPFRGWVASANNRPAVTDVPITFLFSDDERVQRLNELISAKDKLNREDVAQISRDVFSAKALRLKSGLIGILDAANVELPIRNELLNWDGFYREDSRGALAFELLLGEVVSKLYHRRDRKFSSTKAQWSYVTEYLLNDLQAFEPSLRTSIMREAMARAQKKFVRHQTWGAIHHTRIGYLLSAIPLLGKNFEVARFPSPGSRETAYKSAHGFEHGPHFVKYGSQARYIFDMGGPDDNYVVLLGGQDGLLGSVNFDDQIPLWRSGKYIQLPLSVKDTDENFKWVSVIKAS